MQDPLFPGIAGDSYIYWGDAWKWIEERGYQVLRYTGPSPEVPLAISACTSMLTNGVNDAVMQGGTPEPDSTLPLAATTEGTSCQHPKVECAASVKRANPQLQNQKGTAG